MNPWGGLKIIDAHAHVGDFKGYDLSWKNLRANLDRRDISVVLVSNIDGADLGDITRNLNETEANKATAKLVAYDARVRGLAWARPVDGKAQNLESFLQMQRKNSSEKMFVGIKLHPEMNHFAADDTRVDPYLVLCERFKVPAVVHCGEGSSSAKRIYALAKRHRTVPIVLYHMGFGTDHQEAIEAVAQAKKAHDADLYLETAQANPTKVLAAIKKVGSDRVLFGTDATYYGANHYEQYDALIQLLRTSLSKSDLDNVLSKNAARLFKLTEKH